MATILVVDDLEYNVYALSTLLRHARYDVVEAYSAQEALLKAHNQKLDGVLLDVQMPGMDGLEVCRRLKSDPATSAIPVMFVGAPQTDEESVIQGLQLGANDYVVKPITNSELLARVSVMVRIKTAEDEARRVSVTDELTGLYNRRFLTRRMAEEIARARRNRATLCCLIVDLDHFKAVNDEHGHTFGDYLLRSVANLLTSSVRTEDIVARYGGEEFIMILTCPVERALDVAERLRQRIEQTPYQAEGSVARLTVSIGLSACSSERPMTAETLFKLADDALYQAKRAGRNRIALCHEAELLSSNAGSPPNSR